jgi:hypothetical protein
MATKSTFNPDRMAYFEAAGWRAYSEHAWMQMLGLIVALNQEQFRIPFPMSWLAAYYVVRASAAWVPTDHDESVILGYLEKFYKLARRYSDLSFDPIMAARHEIAYWDVHRRLSGKPDKRPFIEATIKLHSTIFSLTPEQARESAELRVLANNTVDLITSKTSSDPERDWRTLEGYLRDCYRSIRATQQAAQVSVQLDTQERLHAQTPNRV